MNHKLAYPDGILSRNSREECPSREVWGIFPLSIYCTQQNIATWAHSSIKGSVQWDIMQYTWERNTGVKDKYGKYNLHMELDKVEETV